MKCTLLFVGGHYNSDGDIVRTGWWEGFRCRSWSIEPRIVRLRNAAVIPLIITGGCHFFRVSHEYCHQKLSLRTFFGQDRIRTFQGQCCYCDCLLNDVHSVDQVVQCTATLATVAELYCLLQNALQIY